MKDPACRIFGAAVDSGGEGGGANPISTIPVPSPVLTPFYGDQSAGSGGQSSASSRQASNDYARWENEVRNDYRSKAEQIYSNLNISASNTQAYLSNIDSMLDGVFSRTDEYALDQLQGHYYQRTFFVMVMEASGGAVRWSELGTLGTPAAPDDPADNPYDKPTARASGTATTTDSETGVILPPNWRHWSTVEQTYFLENEGDMTLYQGDFDHRSPALRVFSASEEDASIVITESSGRRPLNFEFWTAYERDVFLLSRYGEVLKNMSIQAIVYTPSVALSAWIDAEQYGMDVDPGAGGPPGWVDPGPDPGTEIEGGPGTDTYVDPFSLETDNSSDSASISTFDESINIINELIGSRSFPQAAINVLAAWGAHQSLTGIPSDAIAALKGPLTIVYENIPSDQQGAFKRFLSTGGIFI